MLPTHFKSNTDLNNRFHASEPGYIRLIQSKARTWARRGAGDVDDLVQEGRCALLHALDTFDPQRGQPLHVYLGRILDNTYTTLLTAVLAQKRRPSIWEQNEDGTWKRIPYPVLSLDEGFGGNGTIDNPMFEDSPASMISASECGSHALLADEGETPEEAALTKEQMDQAKVILVKLQHRLSPGQLEVLDCLIRPLPGLIITARNLSGSYHVKNIHVAAFLGITKNQVDYALSVIRRHISELLSEAAAEAEASVNRG